MSPIPSNISLSYLDFCNPRCVILVVITDVKKALLINPKKRPTNTQTTEKVNIEHMHLRELCIYVRVKISNMRNNTVSYVQNNY